MAELIRDTAFGHLVRFVSRGKVLQFAEERDPSTWTRYIDEKKSGYMAHHGDAEPPKGEDGASEDVDMEGIGGVRTREARTPSDQSSRTRVGEGEGDVNLASGVRVDPEKGRDVHIVSWYGDDDPGTFLVFSYSRVYRSISG